MIEPGYYQMRLANLTYRELFRLSGVMAFPVACLMKWGRGAPMGNQMLLPESIREQVASRPSWIRW